MPPITPKMMKPKRVQTNTTFVSNHEYNWIFDDDCQVKLLKWLDFRQSCLDELLRHDGHADFFGLELCTSCKKVDGVYKCLDCFSGGLLHCRECLVTAHYDHPLHQIEVSTLALVYLLRLHMHRSNGTVIFLKRSRLKTWDFVYSSVMAVAHVLSHHVDPRTSASSIPLEFTTFQLTFVTVERMVLFILVPNFCVHAGSLRLTHGQRRLLPSTVLIRFTYSPFKVMFDCLEMFHLLTFQGKTPLYDFYRIVLHKTDNMELQNPVVSFFLLICFILYWVSYLALLPRVPPCVPHLAESAHAEVCRSRAAPEGCNSDSARQVGSRMSCMSSSQL